MYLDFIDFIWNKIVHGSWVIDPATQTVHIIPVFVILHDH